MNPTEERLNLEIMKLLIQVAWADHEVAEGELEHLRELARQSGLGDKSIETLDRFMAGEGKLPAPDFGFLRQHREAAIAAAEAMVHKDQHVDRNEEEILDEIRQLLGC